MRCILRQKILYSVGIAISDKEKYEQETMSFQRTMDSFKKIIIVEKSMKPRYDENGYLMMGLKEFLLDANSLLI